MPRFHITAEAVFGYRLYLRNQLGALDNHMVFGPADSPDELRKLYNAELVTPYQEEGPDLTNHGQMKTYTKYFRKGGPMEWCQPIENDSQWQKPDAYGTGIAECLLDIFNIKKTELARA